MKTNLNLWSIGIACVLMQTACMKEDSGMSEVDNSNRKIVWSGDIEQVYQTRVNDAGFCNGDEVGIYITDYLGTTASELKEAGNRADNVKHTFNEESYTWSAEQDIYWKDNKTPVDIYGYYPYGEPERVRNYAFEVQKDQSTSAAYGKLGGYEASDFLWGKAENVAPTDKVIRLSFRHKMASIKVSLAEGSGFAAGEWNSVEKAVIVLNTKRKAQIDLATGVITASGEVPSTGTIPYRTESGDYRAIVVPQDLTAGLSLFSITVDGTPYLFQKSEAFTYLASKQHNFTITVNKRATGGVEFQLTAESITAWENDNVSHDATAREYIVIDVATPGTLGNAIVAAGKEPAKVKNLKITGTVNAEDFYFMRDKMDALQAVNLKEIKIVDARFGGGGEIPEEYKSTEPEDNIIPERAFDDKKSLLRVVLPDQIKAIGERAFRNCVNLTGSVIIPEGVTRIGASAYLWCGSLTGSLVLPSTLEYIGGGGAVDINGAFAETKFSCELKLPSKLKYIGHCAFNVCTGLYGSINLPDGLKFLGDAAFGGCANLTGNLEIPKSLTQISYNAFVNCGFNGQLILHDDITSIGSWAFGGCGFKGELVLPKNLTVINSYAFSGCDFSGVITLPEDLAVIGDQAFAYNWRLSGVLNIPENVVSVGQGAFSNCRGIEKLVLPQDLETIQNAAFDMCTGIGSIVCKGAVPAHVLSGAFNGVPKDNFTVEVPESAVSQYQTAVGWSDFKRISAYRNLVIRPAMATALNTSVTRDLTLNADEDWLVESKPDWVSLDKTSGNGKTALKITFSQMAQGAETRTGEVVFKLADKAYRTRLAVSQYDYAYAEDQVVTLQTKSKGSGVNVVLLGDGFSAQDISEGKYLQYVNEAVDHLFGIEPYTSYKEYFNVYTAIAVSPESGIGGINTIIHNRFNTSAKGGMVLGGRNGDADYTDILAYACKAPTVSQSNINQTLVLMIPNTPDYGGICYMYDDGTAIAYCPISDYGYPFDFRGVIQHEAGGHGFGKLGDEYIYHNAFIDACPCACCPHDFALRMAQAKGWYQNLSLTGKMNDVPWSHLIFDEKYRQTVDIYEGGFMHTRGVYRSEQNSCMNNNIPYYNTISREEIVKRIKAIAGESYSYADFKANDVMNAAPQSRSSVLPSYASAVPMYMHEPVMMGKRPTLNVK